MSDRRHTGGVVMDLFRPWVWCAALTASAAAGAATLDPLFSNSFERGLVAFGPPLSALPQGATNATSEPVALTVALDGAAAAPTVVSVVSGDPARLQVVGGGATVATGQTTASVRLNALGYGGTPVVLRAAYGNTIGASVRIERAVNETDLADEADYCILQFPAFFSVAANQQTPVIYSRLYEAGSTETPGAAPGWIAEVGYGPPANDPRTLVGWHFAAATYNVQVGNDDEYRGTLTAPATPGTYAYAARFSRDDGGSWTYCDLDGAGSNAGLTFATGQLGSMTVTAAEPAGKRADATIDPSYSP